MLDAVNARRNAHKNYRYANSSEDRTSCLDHLLQLLRGGLHQYMDEEVLPTVKALYLEYYPYMVDEEFKNSIDSIVNVVIGS